MWLVYDHQGTIKGFQVSFVDRAFVVPAFGDYLCYRGTKHPIHIISALSFAQFLDLSTCYYPNSVLSTWFTPISLQMETPHKVLYGWGSYLSNFKIIIDGTRTRSVLTRNVVLVETPHLTSQPQRFSQFGRRRWTTPKMLRRQILLG